MVSLDPPKLRLLSIRRFAHQGQEFALLEDPFRLFTAPVLIPIGVYLGVVRHFNGRTSLTDIQARVLHETGERVTSAELRQLVEHLDRALVLDGPTFAAFHDAYRRERVRPAALAGLSYDEDEQTLRATLRRFFVHARGGGFPREHLGTRSARLRGVLSPHIDFDRGGPIYTWAYKELVEQSDAEVFVILGVAHQYCRNRFALTRKDFQTPLGLAPSDRAYVDQIAERAGSHLFEDELAHRIEHSVEFQVVFLQYLLGRKRPFAIVPILVGSFHDLMEQGIDPIESDEVRRFIEALRAAEVASGKKVAYIGAIDLCHVGPEFGDPAPVDSDVLDEVCRFDQIMLARASALDPKGWFGTAAAINNRWRVCGLAATYTMLHTLAPARGRLLRYDQAVDARRTCCVTFASLAFDAPDTSEVRPRD